MTKIPTPLELPPTTVKPEWIDFNGHMNVAYYLLALDEASETLDEFLGLSAEYRETTSNGTFAGNIHIAYLREVKEGDPLRRTGRVIACDAKRVHCWMEMYHAKEGYLAAEAEAITLHIDLSARKVAPFPPEVKVRLQSVYKKHKNLRLPKNLGRQIKVKRR